MTGNVTMAGRRSWDGKNVIYEENVIYACGHPSRRMRARARTLLSMRLKLLKSRNQPQRSS